jgi:maltooligosyltrehalose trehalohydrolase
MLFMGEEFGASQPFPFFAHFEPKLADVREGRSAEFAKFPEFQDPHKREKISDPSSEQTF